MLIRAGFDITFECAAPTPMLLQVHVHPDRETDLQQPEHLTTQPYTPYSTYIDGFGNRCTRLVAPAGG